MGKKRQAFGEAGREDIVYCGEGDPLLTALFENDVEGAQRMLKAGDCDVEVCDHLGWRPLHRAAFGGHETVLGLLLAQQADACACDHDGLQPLHVAASRGHIECCRALLAARADPTASDVHGLSAQMHALLCQDDVGTDLRCLLGVDDASEGAHGTDADKGLEDPQGMNRAAGENGFVSEGGVPLNVAGIYHTMAPGSVDVLEIVTVTQKDCAITWSSSANGEFTLTLSGCSLVHPGCRAEVQKNGDVIWSHGYRSIKQSSTLSSREDAPLKLEHGALSDA